MKQSIKKILWVTVLLLFLSVLIFTAVYLKSVVDYQNAVREATFCGIDIPYARGVK